MIDHVSAHRYALKSLTITNNPFLQPVQVSWPNNIDVVRVFFAVAVEFITNLEQGEERPPFPNLRKSTAIDKYLCMSTDGFSDVALSADVWADDIMQMAEEKGIDDTLGTWQAVRHVKAAK